MDMPATSPGPGAGRTSRGFLLAVPLRGRATVSAVATMAEHTKAHHQHHTQIGQRIQDMEPMVGDQIDRRCGNEDGKQALRPRPGRDLRRGGKIAHALSLPPGATGRVEPNGPPGRIRTALPSAEAPCATYP
ncbi:hypothetical protein ASF98_05785 [Arthrobacter sp. Leaf337]|nr:hypothetical protein ASF98_05785 [Arthrobacter sp. Leaf337]